MDWWLATFLLGALLSLFFPIVPTIFYVVLCLAMSIMAFWGQKTRKLSVFFLGIAWVLFNAANYQYIIDQDVPLYFKGKSLAIGQISNIAQVNDNGQRFDFIISKVGDTHLKKQIKVRLSWKNTQTIVEQNQLWQFFIKVKPAHGLANIGGFSYKTWLRKNGIHATGYIVKSERNALLKNETSSRQGLYNKINSFLPVHSLSPLILALTFGERGQLTKSHWQVLQNTATQHLIAISGLHLGLIASGSYFILSWFMRLLPFKWLMKNQIPPRLLLCNYQVIVISLSCLTTLLYAYFAGFSIPTLRALIMLSLFWGAKFIGVKLSVTRWLLISVFIIVISVPFSLFSTSFWLSFYAVSIIFLLLWRFSHLFSSHLNSSNDNSSNNSYGSKISRWCLVLFCLQVCLIILMLPLTVSLNNQLSLVAIPANIIAVPWMSVTTIPLSLLSVVFLYINESIAQILLQWSLYSLEILWLWLNYLSESSLASLSVSVVYWLLGIGIIIGLVVYFLFDVSLKSIFLILLVISLVIFSYKKHSTKNDVWYVNVMDVGQGLAVVIEAQNQVLIYDTGASFSSGFSMAESVLIPYLKYQGYKKIDKLIISHDDNDHSGGLDKLSEHFMIDQLIYNQYPNAEGCLQGQQQTWQFLTLEMLWPNSHMVKNNDDSCVVKISDGKHSVLLTGDISKKVENQLLQYFSNSNMLDSDYLIVPHHGSKTSSSLPFLKAVSPKVAIFSAGYLNRWNMPVESVVERYQQLGITTFNSATDGMIRIKITPEKAEIQRYRQQLWPFWFAN